MNTGDELIVRDFFRARGYKSGWQEIKSRCRLVKESPKTITVQFFYYGRWIDRIDRIPKDRIIEVKNGTHD